MKAETLRDNDMQVPGKPRDATVYICSLAELPRHAQTLRPSHLVSVVPGYEQPQTPACVPPGNHLRLELDDIETPLENLILPSGDHVEQLVRFADRWDGARPILFHCAAGVSRSTAAALVALCRRTALGERELVAHLCSAAPHASPNRRIIRLADEFLGRKNRLMEAVDALCPVEKIAQGPLVRLTAPLGAPQGG